MEKQCTLCGGKGHHAHQCWWRGAASVPASAANDNRPQLPRVYIAGRMSGLPDLNYPMFHAAASHLRQLGYKVESPAECELPPDSTTWQQFMRSGITQLMRCDAIVMLPGWEQSRGATAEHAIAKLIDIPVLHLDEAIVHGQAANESAYG